MSVNHTISVLVTNEVGVLSRIVDLFSGRGYNIESLTVSCDWDGKIEIEETIGRFVIGGGLDVKDITDTIATQIIEYVQRSYTDQVQGRTAISAFCRPVAVE